MFQISCVELRIDEFQFISNFSFFLKQKTETWNTVFRTKTTQHHLERRREICNNLGSLATSNVGLTTANSKFYEVSSKVRDAGRGEWYFAKRCWCRLIVLTFSRVFLYLVMCWQQQLSHKPNNSQ